MSHIITKPSQAIIPPSQPLIVGMLDEVVVGNVLAFGVWSQSQDLHTDTYRLTVLELVAVHPSLSTFYTKL